MTQAMHDNSHKPQEPPTWISQPQLRSIISDAERFAAFLRQEPAIATVNYCGHRYHFWVTLFASLLANKENLLPPSAQKESAADLLPTQAVLAISDSLVAGYCHYQAPKNTLGNRSAHAVAEIIKQAQAKPHFLTVFTSGSTGAPKPIRKTWQQLANRAESYIGNVLEPSACVVAMVPAQHMYGLETSVFTSLLDGFHVYSNNTPYPSDVVQALLAANKPATLITTPNMLRLLLKSGVELQNLNSIVSATSPLNAELKTQCERAFGVGITEIYGFSEAGSVAWRRNEEEWQLLPGLSAQKYDSGTVVIKERGHTKATVEDRVELIDSQTLLLKGRPDDLVKMGGKRASLAGLIQKLQALPGVDDGHIAYDASREVLEAFVVANTRNETAKKIQRRYAKVCELSFVPRRFTLVDKIPRSATGKVSKENISKLQQQLHQKNNPDAADENMTCNNPGNAPNSKTGNQIGEATTSYEVSPQHPAMAGHFPGNPIVPAAVILSYVSHHAQSNQAQIVAIKRCKFLQLLKPGEKFSIELNTGSGKFSVLAEAGLIAKGTALLAKNAPATVGERPTSGG